MRHPFRTLFVSSSSRALRAALVPTFLLASLVAGCSDDPVQGAGPDGVKPGFTQLTNANNYQFDSTLHIQTIEVQAESDLTIKWDGIKKDIQCHDVKPADDIDTIMFLRFKSTSQDEVAELLDSGTPSSTDLRPSAPVKFVPDGVKTSVKLSDFTSPDGAFVPEDSVKEEPNVNLLIFQNGTNLGQNARAMLFVKPSTATTTTIDMTDYGNADCSLLTFSANLHDLEQVPVAKDADSWKLEWTQMKVNGQGQELARPQIDRMLIGFYEGMQVKDLEDKFLDLEEDGVPTESYELTLDAVSRTDLANAKDRSTGAAFPGFDNGKEGTWIMGLFCDSCSNPAPLVLTILKPE